jgi:hypothetical protein
MYTREKVRIVVEITQDLEYPSRGHLLVRFRPSLAMQMTFLLVQGVSRPDYAPQFMCPIQHIC